MDYTNILTILTHHLNGEHLAHAESLAKAIYSRAKDFSRDGVVLLILSVSLSLNENHVTLDAVLEAIKDAEGGE